MATRVLVVGCGGIGGNLAGRLLLAHERGAVNDLEVVALTTNEAIAEAVSERGYRLVAPDGQQQTARGRCVTSWLPADGAFDWIFLAVQPPQVEEAARHALPLLASGGQMVCFQNGLCEARVAALVGPERVLGAVVSWGASMEEPGLFVQTSEGGFTVGRMGAPADDPVRSLSSLLATIAPTKVADDLAGVRWSKLAINCAISTLGTLGGDRLGTLLGLRFVRRLALEIMTEVVDVARAEDVHMVPVAGTLDLGWLALTPTERQSAGGLSLTAKHAVLLAVGARYRNLRSSMLSAIERGRPPAVDFLNGEIVQRAELHGLAVPANAWAREAVWALSRGERASGLDTLREMAGALSGR